MVTQPPDDFAWNGVNTGALLDWLQSHDIDDLMWRIECRRNSRTHGPPLPSYMGWYRGGWRPGDERWLRTSDHRHEYLDAYLRYVEQERKDKAERAMYEARREASERARVKAALT